MTMSYLREKAGLKQKEVSRALNVDRTAISKWETGESLPRAERLIKLAELYNCTTDELLGLNRDVKKAAAV